MHRQTLITGRELIAAKGVEANKYPVKVSICKLQPLFFGIIVISHFRNTS